MIPYNDYLLTDMQLSVLYAHNEARGIRKHIEKYGVEPEDPSIYRTATEEEIESYRKRCYARETIRKAAPLTFLNHVDSDPTGYLFECECNNLKYDKAMKWFKHEFIMDEVTPRACSAIRKDNLYGRNLDWYYNQCAEVVVRTPRNNGLHATLGCAGSANMFSKQVLDESVETGIIDEKYDLLPFFLLDGINDAGLIANTNVVPTEDTQPTTGTIPSVQKLYEVSAIMLVRFILDHFTTAAEAVEYIGKYVSIYAPHTKRLTAEIHTMIADANDTYIIECINNEYKPIKVNARPMMTNFFINGVTPLDEVGHVNYTGCNITEHGCGLERYNLMVDAYGKIKEPEDMMKLMSETLRYTQAYETGTTPFWYSEYVGGPFTLDLITTSPETIMQYVNETVMPHYINRDRDTDTQTWETSHTSVYNMADSSLMIKAKENSAISTFAL